MHLQCEDISQTFNGAAAHHLAAFQELQGRNFDFDVQFRFYEITNVGIDLSGSFEDDERPGLRNSEINGLSGRWIGGVYSTQISNLSS